MSSFLTAHQHKIGQCNTKKQLTDFDEILKQMGFSPATDQMDSGNRHQ